MEKAWLEFMESVWEKQGLKRKEEILKIGSGAEQIHTWKENLYKELKELNPIEEVKVFAYTEYQWSATDQKRSQMYFKDKEENVFIFEITKPNKKFNYVLIRHNLYTFKDNNWKETSTVETLVNFKIELVTKITDFLIKWAESYDPNRLKRVMNQTKIEIPYYVKDFKEREKK